MKLKVTFTYNVDPETGNMELLCKDEVTVDTEASPKKNTTKKSSTKVDTNTEPLVTLDTNKLIFTQGAIDLLQICEDCRVDIKYKKKDKKAVPVIGTDSAFGTKGGTVLTKSNTTSFRGAKNDKLAAYGTVFKLEPTEETGIYYLVGDKVQEENPVPEEIIDIESELDLDSLDDLNIDEDDKNLGKFDFKL